MSDSAAPVALPSWLEPVRRGADEITVDNLTRFEPPEGTRTREGAVLMLFGEGAQGPDLLLTERAHDMRSHPGQVSFPGGSTDPGDASPAHTALREAHEEIGLGREHIEVIGRLPTYTTGTQFLITPVVALVDGTHRLTINPYEVADAFEVPLAFLMNPAHHRHHELEWAGARREWLSMPYMDGMQERFIWGATAAMLRNFYRFLAA